MRSGARGAGKRREWPPIRNGFLMRVAVRLACVSVLVPLVACATGLPPAVHAPPRSVAVTSAGPSQSMIHATRTGAGLLLVDLGWWGAEGSLEDELSALDAGLEDVDAVLVTHAHRDHIRAWPQVKHATFYMAEAELDHFHGVALPDAWIPRVADQMVPPERPAPDEVEVLTFSRDTTLVFGADTVRTFLVPGHTAGSTAYLVGDVLFVGDAVAHTLTGGPQPALALYSDDAALARESLHTLRARLRNLGLAPAWICTAHARCEEGGDTFWDRVLEFH
ncbi:MAG: MBL fold metallo-hydrolase [Gemmatimonadales bacterium]|nr:MAG: MBL fold metallo-hydrolase [Gemmatimonadales bacterium]